MNTNSVPEWFLDLYAPLTVNREDNSIEARWRAISAVAKSIDEQQLRTVVQLAIDWHIPPAAGLVERLRSQFTAADKDFPQSGNALELQIMAYAVVIRVCEGGVWASRAAASLYTAGAFGERGKQLRPPARDAGVKALARLAREQRVRPALDVVANEPNIDLKDAKASFEAAAYPKGMDQLADAVKTGMRVALVRQTAAINALTTFIKAQDEELQVLWWLMGGVSLMTREPFAEIPSEYRSLVIAAELAQCTNTGAGLPALDGFIARAQVSPNERVAVIQAINRLPREIKANLIEGREADPLLQPIRFAVSKQYETNEDSAWVPGWAAATGLHAALEVDAMTLAKHFYVECLVAKAN